MDSDTNHAMCFGHTVVVTETGCESLSQRSLELVVTQPGTEDRGPFFAFQASQGKQGKTDRVYRSRKSEW